MATDSCISLASVQFSSIAQLCPTLCDPMNCSTPGLPVHHQLPEFTQTLSITNSRSSLRLTSIESVMPSSHLILCHPLLLLPPQSLPASESFPVSQLFSWGGQTSGQLMIELEPVNFPVFTERTCVHLGHSFNTQTDSRQLWLSLYSACSDLQV